MPSGKKERKPWKFSVRERRALLLLIPLMAVLVWILWSAGRSHFDGSAEVIGNGVAAGRSDGTRRAVADAVGTQYEPFDFDPNTAVYEDLRRMGLTANTAASLIRWREAGKIFRIPEDFATVNGISDSVYAVFKPYIIIGDEYRIKRREEIATAVPPGRESRPATEMTPFDPNVFTAEDFACIGFSPAQAAVIVRYRDSRGGFRAPEDLAQCYVVSDEMYDRLKDFIVIAGPGADEPSDGQAEAPALVDINTADSLMLVSVRGIGPRTAQDIIAYRAKLGGFCNIAQLADLKAVTERNYELMQRQIWADSCEIRKIDINFATPKEIGAHPYVTDQKLRKILKNRQLKGGWRTTEDMIEDNTLTAEEALRLSPYLHFGQQ